MKMSGNCEIKTTTHFLTHGYKDHLCLGWSY